MQRANSIIPKIINALQSSRWTFVLLILTAASPVFSQDNSPYSRYGIGDLVPSTNIINRSMGGLSAGYIDQLSINFSNPASYASFQTFREKKSKKISSGRALLDFGLNFDNRTLREPDNATKFTASNALFSYVQIGVPLKQNWGFSFGIRPVSRISYKIITRERLKDPGTGLPIDSASTLYQGNGGSYLISAGTGFSLLHREKYGLEEKLSIGFNGGYLFGEKDYSSRRALVNDTVSYFMTNYETRTNFGKLYFNAGLQYKLPLNKTMQLTIGAYGSWAQKLKAKQDRMRETFVYDDNAGNVRLDSVSDLRDVKGTIELPSNFTIGFILQKFAVQNKEGGWIFGLDLNQQGWSKYRFYGQPDSLRNKWELRAGAQLNPVPRRNYFSNISYRFGLILGSDYVKVGQKLPQFGGSFGLGLPMAVSRQAPNQATFINLAFEYIKRGNNDNLLKENLFRFSLGFSLSDIWFIKRKYE
ncbi:MAG: hypothetical protein HZA79_07870 [Sphingobacteriales bacterium]|nr:hypothetical protein [Sphingobacteriales bacterium]